MFASWGTVAYRRRWIVIIAVLLLTVIGGTWGSGVSDRLTQGGYDDPGSQAAQVDKIIEDSIGKQVGDVVVLYTAPAGSTVDDPALAKKITDKLAVDGVQTQIGVMVLIGALVFGLSTDYETFLLSRMVEARNKACPPPRPFAPASSAPAA